MPLLLVVVGNVEDSAGIEHKFDHRRSIIIKEILQTPIIFARLMIDVTFMVDVESLFTFVSLVCTVTRSVNKS